MKTGIELMNDERNEQLDKHGRTIELDIKNNSDYQLSIAATSLIEAIDNETLMVTSADTCPKGWDYDIWDKMWNKTYEERLIIAGALLAAELDRLRQY